METLILSLSIVLRVCRIVESHSRRNTRIKKNTIKIKFSLLSWRFIIIIIIVIVAGIRRTGALSSCEMPSQVHYSLFDSKRHREEPERAGPVRPTVTVVGVHMSYGPGKYNIIHV